MIQALEAAHQIGITHLTSYVDSQLVCKQLQGKYQVQHPTLSPLHNRCMTLASQLQHFEIIHIRRAYNKEADHLCTALDNHTMQNWASDIPDMLGDEETGLNQQQRHELEMENNQKEQDDQVSQNGNDRPDTLTQDDMDGNNYMISSYPQRKHVLAQSRPRPNPNIGGLMHQMSVHYTKFIHAAAD